MASPPGAQSRADPGEQEEAAAAALQAELGACRAQLERARRRLRRAQRLYRRERESGEALRRQVEELTKEIHNRKEKDTSSVEVQTEDCAAWSQADYYYYENYYNHTDTQDCASELPVQHSHETEGAEHNSTEELEAGVDIPLRKDSTKAIEDGEEENFVQNSQETEETSVPEGSLAESLRAAAEAAVSQTGFIYDENTGLYYDHSTGFYYNSENQLYYDPATGIYYYCDVESGRYQFHSRVDLQSYQASGAKHTKDKKGKKKRKEPDEYKDMDTEEQKSSNSLNCFSTTEQVSSTEEDESPNARKKTKMDTKPRNSVKAKESISTDSINSHLHKSTPDAAACTDDSRTADTESEPEEGEITDSECETYSEEELKSEETGDSEYSENEDEEKIWPPCIRVIVIRSPVLQTGSLYIITAVKPATIGREKDVGHTLQIPEVGVSKLWSALVFAFLEWKVRFKKMLHPADLASLEEVLVLFNKAEFHAEVYFDHDLQNYVLVDQGSQNGTVVNGNQILQPKTKCDPYILEHGDEVKIGETVLSFHIHPGSDTCDGCEPGQVRAHLRLDKKKESSVCPALSKEERELVRRKALKQIRVKYGLQLLRNSNFKRHKEDIRYESLYKKPATCPHGFLLNMERSTQDLSRSREDSRKLLNLAVLRDDGNNVVYKNTEYEDNKAVRNPKYKDRAGKRRETVGSEGIFQRDDSSASVHIEISDSNKGHKMLEKMGWKKGEGLGKDGGGMKDPIQLELHQKHAGLGIRRPTSIEDIQLVQSKNKKNWDKARERFAENFQDPKSQRDTPKSTPWVRGTVD